MITDKTFQLFPDNHFADFDIIKHIEMVSSNLIMYNIGNTYYYNGNNCIRTIKFEQNKSRMQKRNNRDIKWYLTFEVKGKAVEPNLKELTKVRNLLALRSTILERLKKDFDNNHSPDYVELKDKVIKLSNEKTGSHTPFIELSNAFLSIKKKIDNINIENFKLISINEEKNFLASQMKLITDSLISKWYAYSITQILPEQISPKKDQTDVHKLLDFKNVLMLAESLEVVIPKGEIHPRINWCINWDKYITVPDKCDFIWCSAFFALILNALRHGRHDDDEKVVNISVEDIEINKKSFIIISNNKQLQKNSGKDKNGITLIALEYFFNSYGFNGFKTNENDADNDTRFMVWLPTDKEKTDY
jgi:hypothetical protein